MERFNGTLAREHDSEAERRTALVDFLNHYERHRHAAIGHKPPAARGNLSNHSRRDYRGRLHAVTDDQDADIEAVARRAPATITR